MTVFAALGEAFADTPLATMSPIRLADVGANPLGQPIYLDLLEAGALEVWGFEPHPVAYGKLRAGPGRHWVNAALGAPGPAQFYAYPATEMSSLYPLSEAAIGYLGHFKRHLGTDDVHQVDLQSLDEIDDVPPLDALKIDAQGAECQVIVHGAKKLADAMMVVAEMRFYQLYRGEPDLGMLDGRLREQGFVLHKLLSPKSRMIGHSQRGRVNPRAIGSQIIDGDVVYIRSLEAPEIYSDVQLARLALLAAGMVESHDLALFCLDRLVERGVIDAAAPRRYAAALPAKYRA